jgi:hypothetical protein
MDVWHQVCGLVRRDGRWLRVWHKVVYGGGVWMYGTRSVALSGETEGGCGYGIRWCMEVVYGCMAPGLWPCPARRKVAVGMA